MSRTVFALMYNTHKALQIKSLIGYLVRLYCVKLLQVQYRANVLLYYCSAKVMHVLKSKLLLPDSIILRVK